MAKSTANRRKKTYTSSMEYSLFDRLEQYSIESMINKNRIIETALKLYLDEMEGKEK